jgi:membrane-associated PAP2 superfamily phosphatase
MPDTMATSAPSEPLERSSRQRLRRPLVAAVLLLAFLSIGLTLVPAIDLAASRLFYVPKAGFIGNQNSFAEGLRKTGVVVEWIFGIAVVLPLAIKVVLPQGRLVLAPRATLFVLTSFALGPGVVVNGLLKEFWGRARPRELVEFGGHAAFSPAWWLSNQCGRNCSFASGEAASAFCLFALVFLVRKDQRTIVACAALAFATAVSLTRIAAGGHFVSDVVGAWLVTLLVMIGLNELILNKVPKGFDRAIENGAARLGNALRNILSRFQPK